MGKLMILESKDTETSYKWRACAEGSRPFGVADMDVRTDERILEAMGRVIASGDLGYGWFEDCYRGVSAWMAHRYQWKVDEDWITYSPGIMVGMTVLMRLLTEDGDPIAVLAPAYNGFYAAIQENQRTVLECPLKRIDQSYEIDFAAFEKTLQKGARLFILCNPHNPTGSVWEEKELVRLKDICKKYGVPILSDEIHADLTFAPRKHVPLLRCCEDYKDSIYLATSPSKAFNLSALYMANYVIPNEKIRSRFQGIMHGEPNILGCVAIKTAYEECEDWLEELKTYIQQNVNVMAEFLAAECPYLRMSVPEATYMVWLDCRDLELPGEELYRFFNEEAHMDVNIGEQYGTGGAGFVRINVACSRESLAEALKQLAVAVKNRMGRGKA